MKILKNNPLTVICLLVCFGATARIAFARAATSVDAGTIQACYNNTSGELRIVSSAADCRAHETPISWNISGPAGPPGPPGADADVTAFRHTHTADNECGPALQTFSIIDHPSLNGNSNAPIFVTALIGINGAGTGTNPNSNH